MIRKLKTFITISLIFMLLICAGAIVFFFDMRRYAGSPSSGDRETKIVLIAPGEGFGETTQRLFQAGLIASPLRFRLLGRLRGYDKQIKAGEYLLSAAMPPLSIFEIIVNGKVIQHKITVPEGFTLRRIASIVGASKLGIDAELFLKAATDPTLVRKMRIQADSFEGYLFPDTYLFPKGITPEEIISVMVKRFGSVFTSEWKERAESLRLSVHQVVTLASIIEKETGIAEERPIISSVFHNRLKKRMRLESDPTVIYGLKEFNGNITRKHLTTPTPYNTYTNRGLPPGPIANPGKAALYAALYPADTDFIFFVSKKNGTHAFSSNIESHNRAVYKYQISK